MDEISKTSLPILNLLLISAESAVDFVQSEKLAAGIVLRVQPNSQFKSCAKDMVLYAKRKGANHDIHIYKKAESE